MQDGDAIALYNSMRDCLIFLTNLDYEDTESIMLEKLKLQVEHTTCPCAIRVRVECPRAPQSILSCLREVWLVRSKAASGRGTT